MKTDAIEIFQTIRAALQPYAALDFSNRINSDDAYDLWSDKNFKSASESVTERFFAAVQIEGDDVVFKCGTAPDQTISELDDAAMLKVEDQLSLTCKTFKEEEWV